MLWGGQVQSRATLPLELDRSRQRIGFRVDFPRPLTTETLLEWELEMPATRRRPAPTGRITRLGQVKVPPGRLRVEQETPLEADDPPGTWRVRILAGGEVVLERSFEVVAGGSRPAASAR
ncbi:MAG: hypothetical protein IT376_03440 [Polyangiaceae bacterium]|nr:hypothetical protein [Polyangiaceae bacterium]